MGKSYAKVGDFKGHPTITIFTGHEYQDKKEFISMGVRKAAAICDHIDEIRVFVEKNSKE